ncbi:16676_t:CDS:2, partial [Dentiscutata erythropus]
PPINSKETEIVRKVFDIDFKDPRIRKEWFTRENLQESFWKDFDYRMTDIKSKLIDKHTVREEILEIDNKNKPGNGNLFYHLRYSLKLLPNNTGTFAAFTDTISNISNLLPASKYDVPLWSSLMLSSYELQEIINLAMDKLVGLRLCIDIVPQSEYASDLVSSYMRLCLKISNDHKSIIISMPSEAVLAEASAQIMNDPEIGLIELINTLTSVLKNGIVEGGYRGELIARLLLLKA